ncbi:MAG: diguanylate cyclase protein [Anaerosolibacter sp.]|jgi:diguanylate cyclase|uniref:GGDEF domain-containing protein n=1 Tax=Anaerosolibacter sp. TaxID=1872527 RepID=UPI00261FEA5A|nr:diguanylate cyclase [Anaerosolibacter sp.]MDF2548676.1 diguanylate cyclase protein [Anaerosolibacter sp.]
MLSDLIINAAVLVAFISIGNQIFRDSELNETSPLLSRIIAGGISGVLGILLIFYGLNITNKVIIDFRNIAIIIAGTLGGPISIGVAAFIIGMFRVIYYGISDSSIAALIVTFLMDIGVSAIFRRSITIGKKWSISVVYCTVISLIAIVILLWRDTALLPGVTLAYVGGTAMVSVVIYKYMAYLHGVTQSFKRLKEEAFKDHLTGLNNVRQFDRVFQQIMERSIGDQKVFSLLFIDIDFFKKVNDTYGHHEGDRVLRELGKILTHGCRACDMVSRNGGEEFSILLQDCSIDQAYETAERIRKQVEAYSFRLSDGKEIKITISIGISTYPENVKDLSKIIEKADNALYEAKRTGRNKIIFQGQ